MLPVAPHLNSFRSLLRTELKLRISRLIYVYESKECFQFIEAMRKTA